MIQKSMQTLGNVMMVHIAWAWVRLMQYSFKQKILETKSYNKQKILIIKNVNTNIFQFRSH